MSPPPVYSEIVAAYRKNHIISHAQSVQEVDGPDGPVLHRPSPSDVPTERLRRFLAFCLAIDYDLLASIGSLPKDDWCHFVQLSRIYAKYATSRSFHNEQSRLGQGVLERELFTPSSALGIPPGKQTLHVSEAAVLLTTPTDVAGNMLRGFVLALKWSGGYETGIFRFRHCGMPQLAAKLLIDKEIVVPAVTNVDNEALREALLIKIKEIKRKRFVSLKSPSTYTMTKEGKSWDKWMRARPDPVMPAGAERYNEITMTPGLFDRCLAHLLRSAFGILPDKERSGAGWVERLVRHREKALCGSAEV